jgi:type II secretory pathway predicted ATPase ExeA/pSer/pThr/pTyr-binding forkhead associated (FHA) protein
MYEQHFGLNSRPFDLTPDPRFMYMTPQHTRAVASVKFALMNRDSFVILTGEIGIGKTTVLNSVLDDLGPDYVTARVTHTTLSDIELLQALLSEFGMPNYSDKKVLLLDTLRNYFEEQHRKGKHVVVIVDEAQNLDTHALEELRLLSGIDNSDRRIVSIVLTGQRSLDDLVDSPQLRQLRQRARLRQRLEPLTLEETHSYIRHRIDVAGGDADEAFAEEALNEAHRLCFGIPRLLNTLCDTAMMACMVDNLPAVTLEAVDKAAHDLRWQWIEERSEEQAEQQQTPPPAIQPSDVELIVYRAGKLVEQVKPQSFPFVLGRSSANDLVILDKGVSRRHALIDRIGGIYFIEDLNSKNGLLVNRKRRGRALLRSGDIISFGQIDVTFHVEEAHSTEVDNAALDDTGNVATIARDDFDFDDDSSSDDHNDAAATKDDENVESQNLA